MKRSKSPSLNRSVQLIIENLETRCLLSATLLSQVPAQSIAMTGATASVSLGTYFSDPSFSTGDTLVEMLTNLPAPNNIIPLELTASATPKTVANFLAYVNNGEYANTIFHRSVPGFVIQGGGYDEDGTQIASLGTVVGEYSSETYKNVAGTIAMALSTGPNSGTSEWFFNLATNSQLDTGDGGPFTVFGKVIDNGLSVLNDIAGLDIVNDQSNGAWNTLPVQNYNGANNATVTSVPASEFVTINPGVVPSPLTYSVSSSNSTVATAAISNQSLSVTGQAAGTANITVTATDLSGNTASSTFVVTVAGHPVLSVSSESGMIGSTTSINFPITLSSVNPLATTLTYTVTPGTAPASDYQVTGSTLTIPAGSTQANIPITILGDSTNAAETFTLTLSNISTNASFSNGSATLAATGTIQPAPVILAATTTALAVSSTSLTFGGSETFTATIAPATAGTVLTGTVKFTAAGAVVATAPVIGNSATAVVDITSAGSPVVSASYSGDATDMPSTSAELTLTVDPPSVIKPSIVSSHLSAAGISGQPFRGSIAVSLVNGNLLDVQRGVVKLNLYATLSGVLNSDAVLIASSNRNLAIKPGSTVNVPLPVTSLPADLAAGTYTLVVQAVDATGTLSRVAAGPTLSVSAPVVSLTESFTRLTLPAAVVAGSRTSAAAVVKVTNAGNVPSSGITSVGLYASTDGIAADGSLLKTLSRRLVIQPGKFINLSVPLGAYPTVAAGDYEIIAQVVDPQSQVSSAASTSTVQISPAYINLTVANPAAPTTATTGKSIVVSLLLSNTGNVIAAGPLQIEFGFAATADGSNPTNLPLITTQIHLLPGKSQLLRVRLPIPASLTAGTDYLVVDLDPSNTFNESSVTDNSAVGGSIITIG